MAASVVSLSTGAAALGKGQSYDFRTDPPDHALRCGKRVTVQASRKCGGKPATVTGGCREKGIQRQIKCH
jgi:hypothetical protein